MSQLKRICIDDALKMLQKKDTLLIDVRDKLTFDNSHINGAFHLNNDNVEQFLKETNKENSILVICYHGHMSQDVGDFLIVNGFDDVYSIDGGFEAYMRSKNKF